MAAFLDLATELADVCMEAFGEPVTYRAGGIGAGVAVSAVIDLRREDRGIVRDFPRTAELKVSQVPAPARGDTLQRADGSIFYVDSIIDRDPDILRVALATAP